MAWQFFSLHALNQAIAELLEDLNRRPFKRLDGCRRDWFERLDRPALRPLPVHPYEVATFKRCKVSILCGLAISVAFSPRHGLGCRVARSVGHRTIRYSERRNCIKSDPIGRRGDLPAGSSCARARDFISRSICAYTFVVLSET